LSKIAKALEKAKENRLKQTGAEVSQNQETPQSSECDVKPRYSMTRVIDVDENLTEGNAILMGLEDCVVRDRYNLLRTQLLQRTKDKGWNTIMITSAMPGEGKTVTAINLGLSMARESQQTSLLVDANFRQPKIQEYMGLGENKGLADYLIEDVPVSELLINPGIEKLVVLPSGHSRLNTVDLLGSPKLKSLVKDLKSRYPDRYVIYDCPHLLNMPDSLVFSTYVDAVVLVVDHTKATREQVKQATKILEGRNLVGTILNRAN
jgi:exopolysaccharide/PEP-CTERM locus tyrosine autokinase